ILTCVPPASETTIKGVKPGTEDPVTKALTDQGPYSAYVWKTIADPFAGRVTMFRVMTGSLKADSTINNLTKDTPERLGHLFLLQGKTQTQVPEIKAGDIGAVAKLK